MQSSQDPEQGRYPIDVINGRNVPPLVLSADQVLLGTHSGSVHVEAGRLELRGRIQGSLTVHSGAAASIVGAQAGSVHVEAEAVVTVEGSIQGSTHVAEGGEVIVQPRGRLAGSLHNEGRVVVRGVFGGSRTGLGDLVLEDAGYIKQPVIRDGINYYEWS